MINSTDSYFIAGGHVLLAGLAAQVKLARNVHAPKRCSSDSKAVWTTAKTHFLYYAPGV